MKNRIQTALFHPGRIIIFLLLFFYCFSAKANNYNNNKITIDAGFETGDLGNIISNLHANLSDINYLTIKVGTLNNADVFWIRDSLVNLLTLKIWDEAHISDSSLPDNAFKNHINIQSCYFENVTSVGDNAFINCLNLSDVRFIELTQIGDSAFAGCSLFWKLKTSSAEAPEVGEGAFEDCHFYRQFRLPYEGSIACQTVNDGNIADNYWYGWKIEVGGTTVIRVDTDEGGNIDWGTPSEWDTNYENVNGALFWNGDDWVVNDTYGHMYFEDVRIFERIGNYGGVNYLIPVDTTIGIGRIICDYIISVDEYNYSATANDSGTYTYTGIRYNILQPDGTTINLFSRGNGNGPDSAYFDVVLEDNSPGPGITTFREGGIICNATGYSLNEAIENPIVDSLVMGRLVTTDLTNFGNRYFIDINGGNEMGGMSYILETTFLSPSKITETYDSALTYVSEFSVNFKNDKGELESFFMVPLLKSESYTPSIASAINCFPKSENKLTVFPNPATNYLNLKFANQFHPESLEIYDLNGRLRIAHSNFFGNQINISELTSGLYFLVLQNSVEAFTERFVKH